MAIQNRKIILRSRPEGEAGLDNFELLTEPLPPAGPEQVLIRHHYLSLDPYMRRRMDLKKNYAPPHPVGEVMLGGTVGEVLESRHPDFPPGTFVVGRGGWQEYSIVPAADASQDLRKVDADKVPLSYHLGALGMPGLTAWVGLEKICQPRSGETLVVSAASGAVGSAVIALAKSMQVRVVGIAGGPEKCNYAVTALGCDTCVDYKQYSDTASLTEALRAQCPAGVDSLFENVGGYVMDSVMSQMNAFGRIAVCGMISGYDGEPAPMRDPSAILWSRLRVEGFIVGENKALWDVGFAKLRELVVAGRLRPRESISTGIESAPEAFLGMLRGKNLGKQLVKLA
jgi:NADPH-dependent curcumin reductase